MFLSGGLCGFYRAEDIPLEKRRTAVVKQSVSVIVLALATFTAQSVASETV